MEKYSVKKELSLEDFQLMEELEELYYSSKFITPAHKAYQLHLHNPYTGVVLVQGEQIVGFLDILPVSHATFINIVEGRFNDRDMGVADVLSIQQMLSVINQPVSLFVSCAVIHPGYRGKSVIAHLFKEYHKQLMKMISWGVEFDWAVGDCVTLEGERLSKKIGMKFQVESDHETKVYAAPFSLFEANIRKLSSTHGD